MHPAPPPGIDLQAAGIGPFGTTARCALTTDEALELYQDYDICGSRLPYRDAKLASNVAGAELFELWVYDRAIANDEIPAQNTDQGAVRRDFVVKETLNRSTFRSVRAIPEVTRRTRKMV
jgi:hypothetical protein